MKALFHTVLTKLGIRKSGPLQVPRIVAIQGEFEPGYLTLDLAIFNEVGEPMLFPTKTIKAKINPKMRATVNRILAGLETPEDEAILEMYILSLSQVKEYQAKPSGV